MPTRFFAHFPVRFFALAGCLAAACAMAQEAIKPGPPTLPRAQSSSFEFAKPKKPPCSRGRLAAMGANGQLAYPPRFTWAASSAYAVGFCMPASLVDLPYEGLAAIAYRTAEATPAPGIEHEFEVYFESEKIKLESTQLMYRDNIITSKIHITPSALEISEGQRLAHERAKAGVFPPLADHHIELVVRMPAAKDQVVQAKPIGYQMHTYMGLDAAVLRIPVGFSNQMPSATAAPQFVLRVRGPRNRFHGRENKNPPVVFEIPFGSRLSALVLKQDQDLLKKTTAR